MAGVVGFEPTQAVLEGVLAIFIVCYKISQSIMK